MAQMTALDYDTRALRAAAQRVRNCASRVRSNANPKIKRVRNELGDNIKGRTADALARRLAEMDADVGTLAGNLDGIASAMFKYAADLERMARELRARMQG